jgi:hypothetical protein
MALAAFLRNLDDRMLGDRLRGRRADGDGGHEGGGEGTTSGTTPRKRDGLPTFLSIFYRISRLVFLLLATVLVIAIVLILAPANDQNSIVTNVFEIAEQVAGPFKDVFTVMDPDRMKITNYAVASGVYFLASILVSKLPTGGKRV